MDKAGRMITVIFCVLYLQRIWSSKDMVLKGYNPQRIWSSKDIALKGYGPQGTSLYLIRKKFDPIFGFEFDFLRFSCDDNLKESGLI